jgi:hypothetical protein
MRMFPLLLMILIVLLIFRTRVIPLGIMIRIKIMSRN